MSANDLADAYNWGMISVQDASYAFLTEITKVVSWSSDLSENR
jgi:hypothetical protein